MDARDELREGHADVRFDRLRFFCYVDHIGILGLSEEEVRGAMAKVVTTLESYGLATHDFVDFCVTHEILTSRLMGGCIGRGSRLKDIIGSDGCFNGCWEGGLSRARCWR